MVLKASDRADLAYAKMLLEHPSLAAKITNVLGAPIERGLARLPAGWNESVRDATRKALERALDFALVTLDDEPRGSANELGHKAAVIATGAIGGSVGWLGLSVELPVTTTIILRSIAAIARSEGHSVVELPTRLACLEVFALGGESTDDDAAETGYFAVRMALAREVSAAATHVAKHGLGKEGAPALVRLISKLAGRYGLVVSEKAAVQALPAIGAAGGALVNTVFIGHFQDVARGHFIVRRLEGQYGSAEIERAYGAL